MGTTGHPWKHGWVHVSNPATETIIRVLFQFFPGVQNEFGIGGKGSKPFRRTQNWSIKKHRPRNSVLHAVHRRKFDAYCQRAKGSTGDADTLKKVGIRLRECARTIENISRICMDVARASGDEIWTNSVFDRDNFDF